MEPKHCRIESFLIGFSGTTYATEVRDEFEGGEGVVGPSFVDTFNGFFRQHGRDYVKKKVEARVSNCHVSQ